VNEKEVNRRVAGLCSAKLIGPPPRPGRSTAAFSPWCGVGTASSCCLRPDACPPVQGRNETAGSLAAIAWYVEPGAGRGRACALAAACPHRASLAVNELCRYDARQERGAV